MKYIFTITILLLVCNCAVIKTDQGAAIVPVGATAEMKDTKITITKPFEVVDDILDFLSPRNLIASVFAGIADGLKAFATEPE